MEIGPFLREKRKQAGYSLSEASQAIRAKKDTVCNWERNLATPRPQYVKKMLELYGFTLDEYLEAYRESLMRTVDKSVSRMRRRAS